MNIIRGNNYSIMSRDSSSEVEIVLKKDYPLHYCCRHGDSAALKELLGRNNFDIFAADCFHNWCPVHWAAYFGNIDCLMQFEGSGTTDIASHRANQTPLHLAAYQGNTQCVEWLLNKGALLNSVDYLGETPLHKASRTGSFESVNLLLKRSADFNITSRNERTPVEVAVLSGFNHCAALINGFQAGLPAIPLNGNAAHSPMSDEEHCDSNPPVNGASNHLPVIESHFEASLALPVIRKRSSCSEPAEEFAKRCRTEGVGLTWNQCDMQYLHQN